MEGDVASTSGGQVGQGCQTVQTESLVENGAEPTFWLVAESGAELGGFDCFYLSMSKLKVFAHYIILFCDLLFHGTKHHR